MLNRILIIVCAALLCAEFLVGCETFAPKDSDVTPPVKRIVKTVFTDKAPAIDGIGNDSAWRQARPTKAKTSDGTEVTIKAAIKAETINIFLSWPDKTNDNVDEVWEYDGSNWKKGPIDDAIAIFWDVDDSITEFRAKGCRAVCHIGSQGSQMIIVGPGVSNKRWPGINQRGDIWDMSLAISNVRGAGNDYYFGVIEAYAKNPTAIQPIIQRRHDDFANKAPLELNEIGKKAGSPGLPLYALKPGLTVENTPYPLVSQVEQIKDFSIFRAGDRIPYIIFQPLDSKWGGNRDDIKGKGVWRDGRWTVEMSRKLNTGHPENDIIFLPESGKTKYYLFDVAVFDRTITEHTYTGPIALEITK